MRQNVNHTCTTNSIMLPNNTHNYITLKIIWWKNSSHTSIRNLIEQPHPPERVSCHQLLDIGCIKSSIFHLHSHFSSSAYSRITGIHNWPNILKPFLSCPPLLVSINSAGMVQYYLLLLIILQFNHFQKKIRSISNQGFSIMCRTNDV